MTTMRSTGEYTLGAGEAERSRLLAQCELHRRDAEQLVDRIGVAPGWSSLDVGCGPLGVLDVLADRVGPTGAVTGLDREDRYLEMATRSLHERGLRRVALVRAEAADTGLPDAAFDLVHERLVLNNVPRPQEVVAEMVRLTRPGGYVAAQDHDWVSWICQPAHPAWDRLLDVVGTAWGGDVRVGRRLPEMLRAAGLVDVEVEAHARIWRPGDPYHKLLLRFADLHRGRILGTGTATAAELDRWVRELAGHLGHPDTFTLFSTFFQAWGRRP